MQAVRSLLLAALVFAAGGAIGVGSGSTLDVPIPGTLTVVKPGKLVKILARHGRVQPSTFALPAPGSAEDPTLAGAELRMFDVLGAAGDVTFPLDSSGWTGLGNPAGSKGYRYRGKDDSSLADPPCRLVVLKARVIKATCRGSLVTLVPPFSGAASVILAMPAGSGSRRYCAEFGGSEKINEISLMKRRDAPAPAACTFPPAQAISDLDPNDVVELADDALLGRDNNTPGAAQARGILIRELQEMGAVGLDSGQSGQAAFLQPFALGTNVLGIIPGSGLPGEYVMLGAHYDHLGTACPGDGICNGATDNATGVAVVLGIGRAVAKLPGGPRRSIILAFWDAEEDGLVGSAHYVANPLVPIASTIVYLNFDIQGSNLLPSVRDKSFVIGAETGGATLQAQVAAAIAGNGLDTRAVSFIFGQARGDYVNFANAMVPTAFFGDSTGPCYHTGGDDVSVVDFEKLDKQTLIGTELVLDLAATDTLPTFPTGTSPLATYQDALAIDAVVQPALADIGLFSPADQTLLTQIASDIHTIVMDGEANFDFGDQTSLLNASIVLVDSLSRLTCDGFLP